MRIVLSLLLTGLLVTSNSNAQTRDYFIGFTDRLNSPYSLQQPQQYLSQRAINRRTQQGIVLTTNDLPVNPAYVDSVRAKGAIVLNQVKWFNGIVIRCDATVLLDVQSLPFVASSRPVKRTGAQRIRKELDVADPHSSSYRLDRTQTLNYGGAYTQIHQLNADALHNQLYTGQGMLIAVLDAGFNSADVITAFDSLRAGNRILATWDFVMNEASVYEDDAHGTEVLSCLAANEPGQMIGTAPAASYILLRSEDANSEYIVEEYNWAAAAAYADSAGADIITSSLGYTNFDDPSMDHTYADMDGNTCPGSIAADFAASKGMLVLVSVGNEGGNPWHYLAAPSDGDSVIAVGAVNASGLKTYFSSWGPSADNDVKPNVAAMGSQVWVVYYDGTYGPGSGTSFSCPVLAGAAACLWQAHPNMSNMQIKTAIEQSACYYANPGDSLGYGIPDFLSAHLQLGGTVLNQPQSDQVRSIYPNPTADRLFIELYTTTNGSVDLLVYDLSGRLCLQSRRQVAGLQVTPLELDITTLAKGTYQLIIQTKELRTVRAISKVH